MPLRSLGMWVGQAQRATASGERIFQVMDEPEEIADRPGAVELPAGGGRLRFEDVGFEYLDGRAVLQDIDARASSRERRSPASAIRAQARQHSPRSSRASTTSPSGRVTLDGVDVRDVNARLTAPRDRRHLAGSIPLLCDRRGEHRLRRSDVDRRRGRGGSATAAQAHEFIDKLPARLRHGDRRARHHALGRPATAARRSHARLRVDPRVLILDDATASVDVDDRGADPRRPARGDAKPDDADHRPSALDDRARRRDRRARRQPDRRARRARGAARDKRRGLPRHLRARPARGVSSRTAVEANAETDALEAASQGPNRRGIGTEAFRFCR